MDKASKVAKILEMIRKEKVNLIRFQFMGVDLIPRGMVTHADFLEEQLEKGIGLPIGLEAFNPLDRIPQDSSFGPQSPEFKLIPDIDTFALVPYASGCARFIADRYNSDLTPRETDPRYYLRRVVEKAEKMGFKPMAACEPEFYLMRWEGEKPIPFASEKFGATHAYDLFSDYAQELAACLKAMSVMMERLKKESGHSQIEFSIRYSDAVKAADDIVTFRDVAKGVAAKRGLFVSFMPKPARDLAGNGLHVHLSLLEADNKKNAFHDERDERGFGLSKTAYNFMGGIMQHMKEICIFGAPIPNSYKRLLLGSWSPTHIFYGYDNRAAAVRIPSLTAGHDGSDVRLEYRLPDGSANPYLAIGTAIAAGLDGIEQEMNPGDALDIDPAKVGEAELVKMGIELLPRTQGEAIVETKKNRFVRDSLGDPLYDLYLQVRESEWKEYREQVTLWEVASYLTAF